MDFAPQGSSQVEVIRRFVMSVLLDNQSKLLIKNVAIAIEQGSNPFEGLSYEDYLFVSKRVADILCGFLEMPAYVQDAILILPGSSFSGEEVLHVVQAADKSHKAPLTLMPPVKLK